MNKVNEIFAQTFVILFKGPDQKLEHVRSSKEGTTDKQHGMHRNGKVLSSGGGKGKST